MDATPKSKWVAVALTDGHVAAVHVESSFKTLAREYPDCETIAVDMPIGLPEDGHHRECDRSARDFIGKRHRSVFLVPSRAVLQAASSSEAIKFSKRRTGTGEGVFLAYGLRSRIWEVEGVAEQDQRIIEVHPEVSFRALAKSDLQFAKKRWNGQMRRRKLLRDEGIRLRDALDEAGSVPVDDVLDAAVAAWSAHRYATGVAMTFPPAPKPGDPVIWY